MLDIPSSTCVAVNSDFQVKVPDFPVQVGYTVFPGPMVYTVASYHAAPAGRFLYAKTSDWRR